MLSNNDCNHLIRNCMSTKNNDIDKRNNFDDKELQKGLSLTGEDKLYYAFERVKWLNSKLQSYLYRTNTALDFGCGDGVTVPILLNQLELKKVVGIDVSNESIKIAKTEYETPTTSFYTLREFSSSSEFDLVYTNGVFHHIHPAYRSNAINMIHRALRPGGLFAFWENNPWNIGTRIIMSRVAFDKDAIMISPPEAKRMITKGKFSVLDESYKFIFPNMLKKYRIYERYLSRYPIGGQYLILAKKDS